MDLRSEEFENSVAQKTCRTPEMPLSTLVKVFAVRRHGFIFIFCESENARIKLTAEHYQEIRQFRELFQRFLQETRMLGVTKRHHLYMDYILETFEHGDQVFVTIGAAAKGDISAVVHPKITLSDKEFQRFLDIHYKLSTFIPELREPTEECFLSHGNQMDFYKCKVCNPNYMSEDDV